ncbi:DUF350 domain-containing protein [Calditerricola satsumensis]|uniref:DUF350 domain-containing protein n=1 Tax=Calditerricola satsumensis TaxID=373054 RepID=A0A8J3B7U8_9BACI|nr:DUF350 domain-containing protein [Calditerricola satsumensis]GGJ91716.1 DUF350 domain-containing protein [Calditerricola satsumensis]
MTYYVFNFLQFVSFGFLLLLVGALLFVYVTRYREMELIAKGNVSVAIVFGGKLIGLSLVLAGAIANSVGLLDMLIWGAIGISAQILFFFAAEWVTPRFRIQESLENDNKAVALFLFFISLSIGLLIAACMTY